MHDLVIRNGRVVDGTGADPVDGLDVAIDGTTITAIGRGLGPGRREIDASGLLVTPGFVDIHTHYDGQATWDPYLEPSTPHGVTTIVMGNCGVGFAPARPEQQQELIELMEGVEDIPGAALAEGLTWDWESFPEYLDALERRRFAADVAAMIAHGPLRVYVMGRRGADNEPASSDDVAAMATLVQEAIEAGALGFSTSRTIGHRALNGEPVPGTFAAEDELLGIGRALARAGKGVFEVAAAGAGGEDRAGARREIDWMVRLAEETGRPVTWLMLQNLADPDDWREHLELSAAAQAAGHPVVPQVAGRPFGMLLSLQTRHRFAGCPSYRAIAELPLAERAATMARPEVKAAILAEARETEGRSGKKSLKTLVYQNYARTYVLGDPVDYEPTAADSIAGRAAARGVEPLEEVYDRLLDRDGTAFLMMTFLGYSHGNGDALHEMLTHPAAVLGLADGGAHANFICDASTPTWMLTHWVRDRTRGPRLELPAVIRKLTSETAALFGLTDRGELAVGKRADVNVIDLDRLELGQPHLVADLPAGGTRLLQGASGYVATVVAGVVTRQDDAFTGELPGRLVRG